MCGENSIKIPRRSETAGSSPRVRGKHSRDRDAGAVQGLIPACAGKTDLSTSSALAAWAHPRVCGENSSVASSRLTCSGSSPRVRGKPWAFDSESGVARLIPACAGKTWRGRRFPWGSRAHPRVCGENVISHLTAEGVAGSSPRVRGKLDCCTGSRGAYRLIPACAGKTSIAARVCRSSRAHPRVCGENS